MGNRAGWMVMGVLAFAGCASNEGKTAEVTASAPSDTGGASHSASQGAPGSASTGLPSGGASSNSAASEDAGQQGAGPDAASSAPVPSAEACPLEPSPPAENEVTYDFPVRFVAGGAPAVVSDVARAAPGDAGTQYSFSALFMYLSNFALETSSGSEIIARPVAADDTGLPYGIVFVNLAGGDFHLRLRAPSGQYAALSMDLGAPPGCEGGDVTQRQAPLSGDNPLYWTWGNTYMLLNMDAAVLNPPSTEWHGGLFHLGNLPGVTPRIGARIRVAGNLEPGTTRTLELDAGALVSAAVDEMGAKGDVDALLAIAAALEAGEVFSFAQ